MKLDRNIEGNKGKGKYALVRLRGIEPDSEAYSLLARLYEMGHVDWGAPNEVDEFFVIKLRDKYAGDAIQAYATAVLRGSENHSSDIDRRLSLAEYAAAIYALAARAGGNNLYCKEPD